MKKVIVFGSLAGERAIGNMIEKNLPVEVTKVMTELGQEYAGGTESEIREQAEVLLAPYIGKAAVIILSEPEIALSAEVYLKRIYPRQKFVGYGHGLPRLLRGKREVRVLLSKATKRMTRYQELKVECADVNITEREYDMVKDSAELLAGLRKGVQKHLSEGGGFIERALEEFPGDTVVIYSSDLIRFEKLIQDRVRWRATVVDMRASLFRDTCAALNLRGLDGKLLRDLRG